MEQPNVVRWLVESSLGTIVAADVHHIKCPFSRLGYFTSACALLEETVTLIDSGTSDSPEEAIFPYLSNQRRRPDQISKVILTHAHSDHCGGIQAIKRKSHVEIAVHALDEPLLRDPMLQNRLLNRRFSEIFPLTTSRGFEPLEADLILEDGDKISLDRRQLRVIHTPGHSEGSIVLIDEETGICISGDSIQGRGEGRPLLFFSLEKYVSSLRRMMEEPINTLIVGHPMPPYNRGILQGEEAKTFISESLKGIEELRSKVLGTIEKRGKVPSLREICERLPEARPSTIGCIMESLEKAKR